MFEKRKIRKIQLEQAEIIKDIVLMKLNKGIYKTGVLITSKKFYKKLLTSINPTTHVSLYERLQAMVDRRGKMFFSITMSDDLIDGYSIIQGT